MKNFFLIIFLTMLISVCAAESKILQDCSEPIFLIKGSNSNDKGLTLLHTCRHFQYVVKDDLIVNYAEVKFVFMLTGRTYRIEKKADITLYEYTIGETSVTIQVESGKSAKYSVKVAGVTKTPNKAEIDKVSKKLIAIQRYFMPVFNGSSLGGYQIKHDDLMDCKNPNLCDDIVWLSLAELDQTYFN